MLFVELGSIRYTGAYVVYLSFFTNFVLLASFLGVGVGSSEHAHRPISHGGPCMRCWGAWLFIACFLVSAGRIDGQRVPQGSGLPPLPIRISLPVIFALSFAVMASIAQGVARLFAGFEPLEAYRLDIAGSVLGIIGFSAISFLLAPPVVWGIAVVALSLLVDRGRRIVGGGGGGTLWSPCWRRCRSHPTRGGPPTTAYTSATRAGPGSVHLRVNGLPHQQRSRRWGYFKSDQPFRYDVYEHDPDNPLGDVLIVGSGSGNDVAIALARRDHVDAVEIDP